MSVYKIYKEGVGCYIGSTTEYKKRLIAHKNKCNNPNINIKLYNTIRENGGWNEWNKKILLHIDNLTDNKELKEFEQQVIYDVKPNLNCFSACLTEEQRKEKIKQQKKEYREKNKEKLKEYKKEYREKNKEKLKQQRKEYREKNREKIKEYHKEYYQKQKIKSNTSLPSLLV